VQSSQWHPEAKGQRAKAGYIQGLLDGIEFKQTAYALDRDSRKAALARFLKSASSGGPEEEEHRLAA
jgi:hypothetical protein